MADEIHGRFALRAGEAPNALHSAMSPTAQGTDARHAVVDGYAAVFCGHPRWSEPGLQERARKHGTARVLIEQFRERGHDFLSLVLGDFAIAVGRAAPGGECLIAIDRMGICGLYYTITAGELHFASRLSPVLSSTGLPATVDSQALFNYIYFHVIPSPRTAYRDVAKLEPAQCITFRAGKVDIDSYWQPEFATADAPIGRAVLMRETRDCVENAVRRCDEAPATGAFLSGGLDSSTVSGMFRRIRDCPVPTFSIGFDEPGYDELPYARIAARHFDTAAVEHYVDVADIEQAVPRLAQHFEEPFGNSSAIPAYICAHVARQSGMQTLLAGDGGDELFAGNARYAKQCIFEWYTRLPRWSRQRILEPWLLRDASASRLWALRKLQRYVAQAATPLPARLESHNLLQQQSPADVFTQEFLASIDISEPLRELSRRYDATTAENALDRMLFLDWKLTLADNDLRKVNAAGALAGVEVRYPMLDDAVVDASLRIPARLKLQRLELRAFYKKTFRDFLPREIINKSKHGFGLPFGQWLQRSGRLREMVDDSLADLGKRGILNPAFVERVRESHRSEHAAFYGTMIWVLFMFEQWWQTHGPAATAPPHQRDAVGADGPR